MLKNDSIQYGTTTINYDIKFSPRKKNATIAVYPMKKVEIIVPNKLEKSEIKNLVGKKAGWIIKQLDWFNQITQLESTKEFVTGETFLYLGRQYRLKITEDNTKTYEKLKGKHLLINIPKDKNNKKSKIVKAAVWNWYKNQAKRKIADSIKYYSKKLGIEPPEFTVKNQLKRWGSCTSKNKLNFNIRIMMAPMTELNYVIAHELCHTIVKDHSQNYWKFLHSIMPDYEIRKENLRKNGWKYEM